MGFVPGATAPMQPMGIVPDAMRGPIGNPEQAPLGSTYHWTHIDKDLWCKWRLCPPPSVWQKPPMGRVTVAPGGSNYWTQVKMYDTNTLLSIGTPITSDMAFLTMFSEFGTIEGGRQYGNGEFSSEQLYGIRRYPDELRMMSQEVDDVTGITCTAT